MRVFLLLFSILPISFVQCQQYLLILSSNENKISYSVLPSFDDAVSQSTADSVITPVAQDLITDIAQPRSFATWSAGTVTHVLYVYDDQTHTIYRYMLNPGLNNKLTANDKLAVVSGVQASVITVDNSQNLYIIKKSNNEIIKVVPGESESNTYATPISLLSGFNDRVSEPSKLVVDALYLFWSNGLQGDSAGSVSMLPTKGSTSADFPVVIQNNAVDVQGVCVTPTNLFYTSGKNLYVTLKNSTSVVENFVKVNSNFNQPEGCGYDPISRSVYVADSANSLVYQIPTSFTLRPIKTLVPVASADGASDVIIIDSAAISSRSITTLTFVIPIGLAILLLLY